MNFRLTIFLLVVLLIVGGAGLWLMWHPRAEGPATPTLANPVLKPQPKAIETLSVTQHKVIAVAFARVEQHWDLTAPIHALANDQPGTSADEIRNLQYQVRFTAEGSGPHSLEALGLADPRAAVTFTDDTKKSTTLLLGKRTPAKTIYLRIEGDASNTIYEVNVGWYDALDKDPGEFRSKEFAAVTAADVTSVTVTHPKQTVTLSKDAAAGTWSITKPVTTRANGTIVTDLLDSLHTMQVENFSTLTADNPITGLATPVLTLGVTTRLSPPPPPPHRPQVNPRRRRRP